jgi:hypothetical protein
MSFLVPLSVPLYSGSVIVPFKASTCPVFRS